MSAAAVLVKAKAAMESLTGIPYGMGQYLTADGQALPDVYNVYTLISGTPEQHADNDETQRSFRVQVSSYARSGLNALPDVATAMKAQGFKAGPERQLPFDANTRHYGLAKDYFYLM